MIGSLLVTEKVKKPRSHRGGKDAKESRSMIGSLLVTEKVKKPRSHGGGKDAYIGITKHDRKPISHGRSHGGGKVA